MKRILLVALVAGLLLPAVSLAQDDECAVMVQQVLSDVARHCADTGSGVACFGHGPIAITIRGDSEAFDTVGDTLALDSVCCMRLGSLHPPGEWGVGVMKVRPDGAEHTVTYVLLGEVEILNAASFFSELEARVESDTSVYAGPGSHYATLANVAAGDVLHVNACSCTKNWLRVRLTSGEIGWVPARRVTVLGEVDSLPMAAQDTPVYAAMQAFTFQSGSDRPVCASAPSSGVLIQSPAEAGQTRLWINGVDVTLASTLFVQAEPGGEFTIAVLDGSATIVVNEETITAPAGVRVTIPLSDGYAPSGHMRVSPYTPADVEHLPLALLPQEVDVAAALSDLRPLIIGQKTCNVVSDRGETLCALHYVNLGGQPIVRLEAEFVYAAQGKWENGFHESPAVLDGDAVSGDLAWPVSCSLGGANFIGPVVWSVIITDASGSVSPPFEASFNCVDG